MNGDFHRHAATCIGDLPQLLFENLCICRRGNRQVLFGPRCPTPATPRLEVKSVRSHLNTQGSSDVGQSSKRPSVPRGFRAFTADGACKTSVRAYAVSIRAFGCLLGLLAFENLTTTPGFLCPARVHHCARRPPGSTHPPHRPAVELSMIRRFAPLRFEQK